MKTLRSYRSFACLVAMLAAMALTVAAPIASAQTSQGGYAGPGSNVQAEIQSEPAPSSSSDAPSSSSNAPSSSSDGPTAHKAATAVHRSGARANAALPFTGLDLSFVGFVGVGLVLLGFALRRMTLRSARRAA